VVVDLQVDGLLLHGVPQLAQVVPQVVEVLGAQGQLELQGGVLIDPPVLVASGAPHRTGDSETAPADDQVVLDAAYDALRHRASGIVVLGQVEAGLDHRTALP